MQNKYPYSWKSGDNFRMWHVSDLYPWKRVVILRILIPNTISYNIYNQSSCGGPIPKMTNKNLCMQSMHANDRPKQIDSLSQHFFPKIAMCCVFSFFFFFKNKNELCDIIYMYFFKSFSVWNLDPNYHIREYQMVDETPICCDIFMYLKKWK